MGVSIMKINCLLTVLSLVAISVSISGPSTAEMPSASLIQNKNDSKYEYEPPEYEHNYDDLIEKSRQEGIEQGRDIIEQQQEDNYQQTQELLDMTFPDDYGEAYEKYSEDYENEGEQNFDFNVYDLGGVIKTKDGKMYRFEEDGESFRLVPVSPQ